MKFDSLGGKRTVKLEAKDHIALARAKDVCDGLVSLDSSTDAKSASALLGTLMASYPAPKRKANAAAPAGGADETAEEASK